MADLRALVCGIQFPNPVWTAAGPGGRDGEMLLRAARGGAGGLVAKTISIRPAPVPVPNIASPFTGSLLNAELWSELSWEQFIGRELPKAREAGLPVIASVGYSAQELALLGRELERARAADAVEFSIHYSGKDPAALRSLAAALRDNVSVPVLAKLSPALPDLEAAVRALEPVVDGFVAINSLGPVLDFDLETRQPYLGSGDARGWLSGRSILPVGLHYVGTIASLTGKPVIGVGGITRPEDVVKYLMAGASAVQVCSLAVLKGQEVYGKLATGLSDWMDSHGFTSLSEIVGLYHREGKRWEQQTGGRRLFPTIAAQACTLCYICERSCLYQAIHFEDRQFHLDETRCVSCGLCCTLCPHGALHMQWRAPAWRAPGEGESSLQ
jgi:dihydroorotate dehydrogenase subfamily 1